ncbi:MAG TPA: efflux RND transporter periplasmic adaptor subunit [Chitinophagaceae bacterium]
MNKALGCVLLLSCLFCFSCKHKQPPPNPPVPVNLFTVSAQTVLYYDKYPATTAALSQVDLRPEASGFITGIFFTEGSLVKKGQKLYEIDKQLYQQSYDAAVANLKVAQGNYDQAKQDADRYTYLEKYNAVAKQLVDHAVIAQQNADNQVKTAEQAVKTASTNLNYATVRAPFDGTIGFSQVKLGNAVSQGSTVLNTISTNDPMALDFLINESQLAHYQDLEKNKQGIDSLFTIILPNNLLYPYPGKISVIDRAVDPQTGAVRVRLEFPNPRYTLRAGMSCVLRVHNQEQTPQLLIPGKAIVEQMGEYFVFVARDTVLHNDTASKKAADTAQGGPKLMAFQKKVMTGQTIGPNIIITSGLDEGDKIVVDGLQTLHDGSEIDSSSKGHGPNAENGPGGANKKGGAGHGKRNKE